MFSNESFGVGKTIQIYLPDGNPSSVKIAEITSRTIQAIYVPRAKLEYIATRNEAKAVGVYFLVGDPDERSKSLLYVGEAEDCQVRLKQHNQAKDFWNVALVIVSKTQHFTKTHVKFLEWFCLNEVTRASRFQLENGVVPSKPHTPEPVQADLLDNYETIKVLVSTLGYPFFDEIKKPPKREILFCETKDVRAEGEYAETGFIVFKDSQAKLQETSSASLSITNLRRKLVQEGILQQNGTHYNFIADYIFSSPSAAAATVLGYPANGWRSWKYKNGQTLEDVKRNSTPMSVS